MAVVGGGRSLIRRIRAAREKYFGDVGYISRQLHLRYAAWRERDEVALRRRAANKRTSDASEQAKAIVSALEQDGYYITSVEHLGLPQEVVSYCQKLADPVKDMTLEEVEKLRPGKSKIYWIDLYSEFQSEQTPIVDFIASRDIADVCSLYFGQVPFVQELSLYHTPPGAAFLPFARQASQNWHLDNDRPRRLKVFMLPFGADEEAGATMFLPKPSAPLEVYRNFPNYFDDSQLVAFGLDPTRVIHFTGDPGAVMFLDTSRLYHCGSRTKSKSRTVLNVDLSPVTSYLPHRYLKNGPLRHPRFARLNQMFFF